MMILVTEALSRDSVSVAYLACACALAGQRARAQALLDELSEKAKREYVSPMRFAGISANMGDADGALKWLGKSYEAREAMLWWINVTPQPVKSPARYRATIR